MKTVTTVRELINEVRATFASCTAVMSKKNGEYVSYTYETLLRDARRIGRSLCAKGLIGKKIIICGENGYEWVTAYLGIIGYCGTAVPLSRTLTKKELSDAAEHCDAEAVIYGDDCYELISALPEEIIKIPFSSLGGMSCGEGTPKYTPTPDGIAELAYSSGTEGKAKAVMLSHKNICNTLSSLKERIKLGAKDRFYSVLPLTHVNERICGLLCPLMSGASVAYGDGLHKIRTNMHEVRPTVVLCVPFILDKIYSKIAKNIKEKNRTETARTVIKLTEKTGFLKMTLRGIVFAQIHESLGGRLRFFFAVGDSVKYRTLKGLAGFGFATVQAYGLTETASVVSVSEDNRDYSSAGKPFESGLTDIYNIQSDGVGEIRIKSDSVTSGYYGDAEETESHIRDGWLYTGDMGYIDADGSLHIVGRKGNIIAVSKGKQIYPEELEASLERSPYVRECAVVGVPNEKTGDYDTVAIVYPEKSKFAEQYGDGYTDATVMHALEAAVDAVNDRFDGTHKRINRFTVTKTALPRTADGKIIRALIEKNI